MSSLREGNILSIKEETKTIHNSLSREDSIKSNGGYPVGEERASSRSSSTASGRLTREEVSSLMNSSYHEEEEKEKVLESFCHSIFDICDTDKDGYITINELLSQCDDVFLMDTLSEALGANGDRGRGGGDAKISFEAFREGIHKVSEELLKDSVKQSTPDSKKDDSSSSTIISDYFMNGSVYESDLANEEAWQKAMTRIDPQGHLTRTEELKCMWTELSSHDLSLLERFEGFLSMIVTDLEKSQTDVETIQSKIRKLLNDQNREAHEMDDMLQEQLMEAYDKQEKKSQEVSDRISTHYKELLEEREALIVHLSEKERNLRNVLQEKTQTEQELRKEKQELLNLNKTLKDQLTDSYRQLSASQRQLQLISESYSNNDREHQLPWLPGEDPLVETSITTTESFNVGSRSPSVSPRHASSLSPSIPPNQLPFNFNPSSLAVEVEEAMKHLTPGHSATPTADTPTPVPTPEEERRGLLSSYDREEEVGVASNHSFGNDSIIFDKVIKDDNQTAATPVHFADTQSGFTLSQLIPPREARLQPPVLNYDNTNQLPPSRVFKVTHNMICTRRPLTLSLFSQVVILGDSGVGKTSLIRRLTSPSPSDVIPVPRSTLGLDYSTALINVGDETVVFQLWDTAGQERFHSTTAVYFKRADAFIIVYDVTSKNTFENVKTWLSLVKATIRTELPVLMLMGNKSDCSSLRQVKRDEGQKLAFELRALFSETSAKSGDNVLQSHTTLASLLLERENQDIEAIRRSALRLDKADQRRKCKC